MLRRALDLGKRLILPDGRSASKAAPPLRGGRPRPRPRPGIGHPRAAPGLPEVEPAAVDWVLVPGLAFDPADATGSAAGPAITTGSCPMLRPEVPRWALILDAQWVESCRSSRTTSRSMAWPTPTGSSLGERRAELNR